MKSFHDNNELSVTQYTDSYTSSTLMRHVFLWMAAALGISAVTAWLFAASNLTRLLFTENGLGLFGYIVMLCPLLMVIAMSWGLEKMSTGTLGILFILYSILMGISLSFIFLAYSSSTIVTCFVISAGMFAAMAIAGAVTQMDLSKFGSILLMALVGLVIASLANLFMHSSRMDWIISIVGVLVFSGLTAYDVNSIKRMGYYIDEGSETASKISIYCALSLYLDFINLFLYILRIFSRSER